MTPARALELAIQALAIPKDTGPDISAFAEAGPIISRMTDIQLLGGEDRARDAIAALSLAQRKAVSRWLDALDAAAQLVLSDQGSGDDPSVVERNLDRAFKKELAGAISSEHHRERMLMLWRRLRKLMPPARAFVYFMIAVVTRIEGAQLARWSMAVFARQPNADEQEMVRADIQTIILMREFWNQRQAQTTKVSLKPRIKRAAAAEND
jgi:hypothetical protein